MTVTIFQSPAGQSILNSLFENRKGKLFHAKQHEFSFLKKMLEDWLFRYRLEKLSFDNDSHDWTGKILSESPENIQDNHIYILEDESNSWLEKNFGINDWIWLALQYEDKLPFVQMPWLKTYMTASLAKYDHILLSELTSSDLATCLDPAAWAFKTKSPIMTQCKSDPASLYRTASKAQKEVLLSWLFEQKDRFCFNITKTFPDLLPFRTILRENLVDHKQIDPRGALFLARKHNLHVEELTLILSAITHLQNEEVIQINDLINIFNFLT